MPEWGIDIVRFVGRNSSRALFGLKYINLDNVPQNLPGGLLVCANHQSFFDPFWIGFPIKRQFRFMTWDAATRWFLIGPFIRSLGAFPVNVERGSKEALKMSLGWLRAGGSLMVFPEGSRSFSDGKIQPFKTGAVRIALDAKVPILPVTIRGANRVWAQDMKLPHLGRVEIVYHPLFNVAPAPAGIDRKTHLENLNRQLAQIIASELPQDQRQANGEW